MDIVTYGTLREGLHNFKYFQADLRKIAEVELKGFEMYSINDMYPACVQTGLEKHTIKCDVIEILSYNTSIQIDKLELGSGYYIDVILLDELSPYKIYLMDSKPPHATSKIESGDWKKYYDSRL